MCLFMSACGFFALIASIACVGLRLFKSPENKVLRIITLLVVFSAGTLKLSFENNHVFNIQVRAYRAYTYRLKCIFWVCDRGICYNVF